MLVRFQTPAGSPLQGSLEPFFVKNLKNVQGDERD
jgi:hypothetical protein